MAGNRDILKTKLDECKAELKTLIEENSDIKAKLKEQDSLIQTLFGQKAGQQKEEQVLLSEIKQADSDLA